MVEIFGEAGVSGTRSNRPAFRQMLRQAVDPDSRIEGVVVYALSRFARSLKSQLEAEEMLEEAGVRILSITDAMGEGDEGRLGRSLVGMINEKYARDASKATRRNRRLNAERGYWNGGPVPFGYEARTVHRDGRKERRKLFVVDEQAEVVRLIYRLAQVGTGSGPMGVRAIAEELNRRGHQIRDHCWFHADVDRVLRLPHYAGSYEDRTREPVNGVPMKSQLADGSAAPENPFVAVACPAIIPADEKAAVAALRAKRAPRVTPPRITNGPTLLTGIARCGEPGCSSGLTIATGKSGRYAYYKCNTRVNIAGHRCSWPTIRRQVLDGIILSELEQRILEPERLRALLADVLQADSAVRQARAQELARFRQQLTRTETAISRLFDLVETGAVSPRDPDFAGRMAERRREAESLRLRIRDLEAIVVRKTPALNNRTLEAFADLIRCKLRSDDPQLRKFYVNLLVSEVTISAAGIRIRGARAALEHAALNSQSIENKPVPSFDREWCRLGDSNT